MTAPEFPDPFADDVQAAGDDLRTLTETSLIVQDPPPAGWRPDPKDVC